MKDKYLYVGIVTRKVTSYSPECYHGVNKDDKNHYLIAFSEAEVYADCQAYIEAKIKLDQSELEPTDVSVVSGNTVTIVHVYATGGVGVPDTTQITYSYDYIRKNITAAQYNEFFSSSEFEKYLSDLKNLKPKNTTTKLSPTTDNIVYVIRKPGQTDEEIQRAALFAKSGVYKLRENAELTIANEIKNINFWIDHNKQYDYYKDGILERKERLVELANSEIVAVKLTAEVMPVKNN